MRYLRTTIFFILIFFSTVSFAQDINELCEGVSKIEIYYANLPNERPHHLQIQDAFDNYQYFSKGDKYVLCFMFNNPDAKILRQSVKLNVNADKKVVIYGLDITSHANFPSDPTNPDDKYLMQANNTGTGRVEIRDAKFTNCSNCVLATGKNIDLIGGTVVGPKTYTGAGNACVHAKELKDSTMTGMDVSGCETGVLVYKSQGIRIGPDMVTYQMGGHAGPPLQQLIDYSNWNKIHQNQKGIYLMSEIPIANVNQGQLWIPDQVRNDITMQQSTTDNDGITFAYNQIFDNTDDPNDTNIFGRSENGIDLDDATVKRFGKLELVKYIAKDKDGRDVEKSLHCEFDKDGKIAKRWLIFKSPGQGKVVIGKSRTIKILDEWKTDNQFKDYATECTVDSNGACEFTGLSDKWSIDNCITPPDDKDTKEPILLQAIFTGSNSTEYIAASFQDLIIITSSDPISIPTASGESFTAGSTDGAAGGRDGIFTPTGGGGADSAAAGKVGCSLNDRPDKPKATLIPIALIFNIVLILFHLRKKRFDH